jgi:hypothetical protein
LFWTKSKKPSRAHPTRQVALAAPASSAVSTAIPSYAASKQQAGACSGAQNMQCRTTGTRDKRANVHTCESRAEIHPGNRRSDPGPFHVSQVGRAPHSRLLGLDIPLALLLLRSTRRQLHRARLLSVLLQVVAHLLLGQSSRLTVRVRHLCGLAVLLGKILELVAQRRVALWHGPGARAAGRGSGFRGFARRGGRLGRCRRCSSRHRGGKGLARLNSEGLLGEFEL